MNVNVNMGPFQIVNKEKIETVLYKFSIFYVQFCNPRSFDAKWEKYGLLLYPPSDPPNPPSSQ